MQGESITIYYDSEGECRQIIRPTEAFFEGMRVIVGDDEQTKRIELSCWRGLVEGVTMSDHKHGVKRYHRYEIK